MTDQNQLGSLILSNLNPIKPNSTKTKTSNQTSKSKSKPTNNPEQIKSKSIPTSNPSITSKPATKPNQKPTTSKPKQQNKPKPKPKPKSTSTSKDEDHTDDKLSKLIKELGGDENDINMIKQINDDDDDDLIFEDEPHSKADAKLKNEVQDLVNGLRFDGGSDVRKPSSSSNHQHPIQKNKKTAFDKSHVEPIEPRIQSSKKITFGNSNEPIESVLPKNKKTTFDKSNEPIEPTIRMNKKIVFGKSNEPIELTTRPDDSSTKPKKESSSNKELHKSKSNLKDQAQDDPESLAAARQSKQEAKALQRRLEAIRSTTTTSQTKISKEEIDQSQHKSNASSWSIEPKPIWYDTSYLPPLISPTKSKSLTPEQIKSLHTRGQFVLTKISTQYTESLRPSTTKHEKRSWTNSIQSTLSESDKTFIHKILTAGTSSDKLSALILLISSSPLLSMSHLTALLSICKKKSRDESGKAIRGLVDWLKGTMNSGLPDRKLKFFADQHHGLLSVWEMRMKAFGRDPERLMEEFEGPVLGDEWLAVWCFEDWFKKWYLEFLGIIEISSHDVLVFNRIQSVSWIYYLLSSKAEQEQNLLRLLVNKLGDREKSVCSRTGYYLLQILQLHPMMKSIITREISALMLKIDDSKYHQHHESNTKKHKELSKVQDHSRYYGTITLNQITLVKDDDELVAKKLIEVYFELFKEILGKSEREEEEAEEEEELNEEEIEEIEVKRKEKLKQKKGKKRLEAEAEEELTIKERQAKLLSAILTGLNRALPYGKIDDDRLKNEIENLFKILYSSTLSVSIQSLTLIHQLIKFHQLSIQDRFYRSLYSVLLDYRLVHSTSQHALFLNLVFKALKEDSCLERVESFVRRIVQVLSFHQAPFICSTLVLLDDLMTTSHPSCRRLIELSSTAKPIQESDDQGSENEDGSEVKKERTYDGKKREPKFANASSFPLWEIEPLLSHYHPSVRLNTTELIASESKVSSVIDLLETHSLNQFLDRFVYKKCPTKQHSSQAGNGNGNGGNQVKGISIMQPSLHDRIGKTWKDHRSKDSKGLGSLEDGGIGFEEFGKLGVEDVNVDQIFLHKYFSKRYEEGTEGTEKKQKRATKRLDREGNEGEGDYGGKGGSDDGSESEDELDEDEVWKAMKRSMGEELDGISDEDDDDDDDVVEGLMDDDDDDEGFEGLHDDGSDGKDGEFDGFDDDDDEDEGDEELMIEDMDDLMGFDGSGSEEDRLVKMNGKRSREGEDGDEDERKKAKKKKEKKEKRWGGGAGVFASAEEFTEMLENEEEEEL